MLERDALIEKLKEVAASSGKVTLTRAEFTRETGISISRIYSLFDGWRDCCIAAELVPNEQNVRIDDDALFTAMRDAFLSASGVTTRGRFVKACRYSLDTYQKRWGRWNDILYAFREWALDHERTFPYLDDLPSNPLAKASPNPSRAADTARGESTGATQFGEVLNFRGLLHTPITEQEVVFLFGMVAAELGFIVEKVRKGFPDCEAKRRIGKRKRWARARIEFEIESRKFRDHGHDPAACDLIVCWEHNWAGCPLEVLELKTAIRTLPP